MIITADPRSRLVLAEADGALVGTLQLTFLPTLATRGCSQVQLTSNEARVDARRFYESLGLTASHVGMKLPLG